MLSLSFQRQYNGAKNVSLNWDNLISTWKAMTLETDLTPFAKNYLKMGASLVFQWLRLPFPWQVVQISSLVRELIPHMFSCVPHFVTQELQQIRLPCPLLTISQNLLKLLCLKLMMPSNHLILCCLLLLLPSIFPSIRVFSNESGSQSIGVSVSASVLSMSTQHWFPLALTGSISMPSKGLSRVFTSTTVPKNTFFSAQAFLWSNSHICTWLLEKP